MASSLLCIVLLQLFHLNNAQHYLSVHPENAVVSIGSSIQLNCSINCPLGIVEWKGLDNANNGIYNAPGYSVQTLENISISMEGTKICVGSCPGFRQTYQISVQLDIYALPDTLLLSKTMKNGVHYLNCSMERVYPPEAEISCYRGSEMLLKTPEFDEVQVEDNLYNVMWSWMIPEEDWLSETSYRCEAQVRVKDQELTREGTLKISHKEETTTAVLASSTYQITSTLSQKLETPYVSITINPSQNPQTIPGEEKDITIGSQQSTTPGKYTKSIPNAVTIQNTQLTQAPSKASNTEEATTADLAFSIFQITSTRSQKETSYLTSAITASANTQTTPEMREGTTIGNHQSTTAGTYTPTAVINTVITQTTQPMQTPNKPINIDGLSLMWTMVPATCLVGSFVLSLLIYRQLSKKGFFQPNHMEFPTDRRNGKSQGSLQDAFRYEDSKQISLY
ncbi:mucosal addressin cell adhesion molecule 1 isoform X1 [Dendropsophus ebraccatus]|uniref:mucosal addressin cell adhesion molecule 1 isoform X1 n=1 Tax=Dendropsophus ebraccatus TaxID=150705 RepID=UPI0038317FE8